MDQSPTILNLESEMRKVVYYAVDTRFLEVFLIRLYHRTLARGSEARSRWLADALAAS